MDSDDCAQQVTGFVPKRHYNELPESERPHGLVFEYLVGLSGQGEAFYYLLTEAQWQSLAEASDVLPGIEALPPGEVPHFGRLKSLLDFVRANGIVIKDDLNGALY